MHSKKHQSGAAAGMACALLAALLGAATAQTQQTAPQHHHDEATGHVSEPHALHAGGQDPLRVARVWQEPRAFQGNLGHDLESGKLFAISHGPPANTAGPSVLYQLDPVERRVLRQAVMPFEGRVASPVYSGGQLFVGVDHQRRLYRIDATAGDDFGRVLETIELPTLNDVPRAGEDVVHRFPFISFEGMARSGDLMIAYVKNLAELVEIDPTSGELGRRIPTLHGLAGISTLGDDGGLLVISHPDPARSIFEDNVRRFMFRAAHGLIPTQRHDRHDLVWVLLDGETGEVLASHDDHDARAQAGSVALLRRDPVAGAPFGRLTLLAIGDEGILEIEWTPSHPRQQLASAP